MPALGGGWVRDCQGSWLLSYYLKTAVVEKHVGHVKMVSIVGDFFFCNYDD